MRESRTWQYLRNNAPPYFAVERMEAMFPPGLPDCFWSVLDLHGTSGPVPCGWLELKYCEADNSEYRAGRIPKLRPEQPMVLRRFAMNGVSAGVLLRVGDIGWLFWKAQPSHDWVDLMRSTEAIRHANNYTDDPFAPGVARLNFDAMIRDLITPWQRK